MRLSQPVRDASATGRFTISMSRTANLATLLGDKSALQNLVELFPRATPLRMPIFVSVQRDNGHSLEETATIEFGTSSIIFFQTNIALELSDKFHLRNSDGSLEAEAVVVAVRSSEKHRAIAARFVNEVRNWIVQG